MVVKRTGKTKKLLLEVKQNENLRWASLSPMVVKRTNPKNEKRNENLCIPDTLFDMCKTLDIVVTVELFSIVVDILNYWMNACLPLRTAVNDEIARSEDCCDCQTLLVRLTRFLEEQPAEFQRWCRQLRRILCCWPTNKNPSFRQQPACSDAWNVVIIGITTIGIDFLLHYLYSSSRMMAFMHASFHVGWSVHTTVRCQTQRHTLTAIDCRGGSKNELTHQLELFLHQTKI
jgi:hypothetical protein